jgi:hypothetical protein
VENSKKLGFPLIKNKNYGIKIYRKSKHFKI